MTIASILFSPILPVWLLVLAAIVGLGLAALGARNGVRGFLWRLIPISALILALANPRLSREEVSPLDDVGVVMVDESASMGVANRHDQAEAALAALQKQAQNLPGLQLRVERYKPETGQDKGTQLFGALDRTLADVPRSRLAGVVMITDGEINDVPAKLDLGAPLHVLLAGHKDERDRRIVVEQSPSFGIVGGTASVTYRVDDPGQQGSAQVTIRRDGGAASTITVPLNQSTNLDLPIGHAGPNVVEIDAAPVPGELSADNNQTAIAVNGVRDRLRVLLVSGEPHAGERTWRNLLKADPSVDLVHFTILRPPNVTDFTPLSDLALISFPVRELFVEKLHDFDLVILDRFRQQGVLPSEYYRGIADYVRDGGALLVAAGPEFAAQDSPYNTALSDILPAAPTGSNYQQPFIPLVTALGKRHPVTAGLTGANTDPPSWGPWVRVVGSQVKGSGDVVMSGPQGQPLLVLDHAGNGRVAELLSDSEWLWSRGFQGGGPQAELLRRLAHWLMKEPDLDENQLTAQVADTTLTVTRRSLQPDSAPVTVTGPDGTARQLTLTDQGDGSAIGHLTIDREGLWRVSEGDRLALAAAGSLNPIEMAELKATPDKVAPVVKATGGGTAWIDDGIPDLRRVDPGSTSAGSGWFGMRANHDNIVTAVTDFPLLPAPLLFLLGFGGLALAWWREGK